MNGTQKSATINAAGRDFTVVGRHPSYLLGMDGCRVENLFLSSVVADLPSGSTLLDVGANIGILTLAMAALRPDCQVIAFEPVPSNLECLHENVRASDLKNIDVVAAAVSNAEGCITITDDGPWSVAGIGGSVTCKTVRLDEFDSPSVAFVKIDVEGFEPNVLAGAPRILARCPLVLMEFNAWALLLHHYDPLVFAEELWSKCEVLAIRHGATEVAIPARGISFVYANIIHHGCLSDILLRPRSPLPDLSSMTKPPEDALLRLENAALRASTSWRVTAPLRALRRSTRR